MLTDTAVKFAKPSPTLTKLSDSGGLQLWLTPEGGKYWRMAYRFDGKQRLLSLGTYPAIGLKQASAARDRATEDWQTTRARKTSSTNRQRKPFP